MKEGGMEGTEGGSRREAEMLFLLERRTDLKDIIICLAEPDTRTPLTKKISGTVLLSP